MIARMRHLGSKVSPTAGVQSLQSSVVIPWWSRTTTMLIFMVMSTIPLWVTRIPPLNDFLGHMARYHVALEIDHNPLLARNWDYHWTVISNLGVDLLIMPIARLIGLEPAAWIIAASLPPLMIWGIYRAAKAIYGSVPVTVLATLPFVLAYPYQYGFVNYWLATALAFHAFAFWVKLDTRPAIRAAVFIPISFAIWICHIYGWAILGVLVGGYELSRVIGSWKKPGVRPMTLAVARTWPLLTVVIAMIMFRSNSEGAETYGWLDIILKVRVVILTLRDQNKILDIVTLIAAVFLIYFGMRDKRPTMDPRFGVPALLFAGAILILPFELLGCGFAGGRLYPLLFITAILSVRLAPDRVDVRIRDAIPIVFAGLFALRIVASTLGNVEYEAANQRHLKALDYIPRGASVAILVRQPCKTDWRLARLEHVGSMAILRRDAFINSQWDVPGGQLLRATRAVGTDFNTDPSQFVADPACPRDLRPMLARKINAIPRQFFDYLWVFDFDPKTLPPANFWTPVYQDENTILYRKSAT